MVATNQKGYHPRTIKTTVTCAHIRRRNSRIRIIRQKKTSSCTIGYTAHSDKTTKPFFISRCVYPHRVLAGGKYKKVVVERQIHPPPQQQENNMPCNSSKASSTSPPLVSVVVKPAVDDAFPVPAGRREDPNDGNEGGGTFQPSPRTEINDAHANSF